jgi:hypothetical protein
MSISVSDWSKGIGLSIAASIVGASSKLAIRKSWLLQRAQTEESNNDQNLETNDALFSSENTQCLLSSRPHNKQWRFYSYALRYAGMFGMSVLNPICCVLAMNYASPSILAPFSGLTLVWVIAFSGVLVDEKPSNSETVAAVLILVGEVIVAAFGDHTNDDGVTVFDVVSEIKFLASLLFLSTTLESSSNISLDVDAVIPARILQDTCIDKLFCGAGYLRRCSIVLDQNFKAAHPTPICLGKRRRCHHRFSKLFERLLDHCKGFCRG